MFSADGTIAPPDETTIQPAPAAPVVQEQDATAKLPPVPADQARMLDTRAESFIDSVSSMSPLSTDYQAQLQQISSIGREAFHSTADMSSRFLQKSVATSGNGTAQSEVTKSLADLREQVGELAPTDDTFAGGFLSKLPFAKPVKRYFHRYETNQKQIASIMLSLQKGSDGLMKDNADLTVTMKGLYKDMQTLSKANVMLNGLKSAAKGRIETEKAAGNLEVARALETEVLTEILQRQQDVVTQAAVSMQAYMAMSITQKNNQQLIKGVERARTTTITALQTAVIVAQALDNQKLVLDQIDAVNKTTNDLITRTSQLLQENTARIQQQSVSSGVSPETLKQAFDSVFATLDSIDQFRAQANGIMEKNIAAIDEQVGRAKSRLDARNKALGAAGSLKAGGGTLSLE